MTTSGQLAKGEGGGKAPADEGGVDFRLVDLGRYLCVGLAHGRGGCIRWNLNDRCRSEEHFLAVARRPSSPPSTGRHVIHKTSDKKQREQKEK